MSLNSRDALEESGATKGGIKPITPCKTPIARAIEHIAVGKVCLAHRAI
jgi:hypothetical protein